MPRSPSKAAWAAAPLALLQIPTSGGALDWTRWLVIPGLPSDTQAKLVVSVLIVLGLLVARRAILALVHRRIVDPSLRYRWAKVSTYVAFVIGLVVVIQIWFTAIRSLGTFLGLVSAGLAIALKDLVADVAGWLFIVWRRPFEVGDRIQIGKNAGDVVDTRIFQFTILEIGNWVAADQSTGRVIHIPNQSVFTEPVANYTTGFSYVWNELPVLVTFESDWRRAKEIIARIAGEELKGVGEEAQRAMLSAAKRFMIHYRNFTPAVYTSVQDSGVLLTLRYLCRPRERRGTAQTLWERILDEFAAEPSVDFAYPTQRLYTLRGDAGLGLPLPEPFSDQ